METITNYLESMFSTLPNTAEVRKAKSELLQMMEDKYNELIEEGKSENTAVGTVISEFGNLDELAADLGLSAEMEEAREKENAENRRYLSLDEAKKYIENSMKQSLLLSIGIFLFISCVAWPILFENAEQTGVCLMFITIAIGVGLIVYGSLIGGEYKFLKQELIRVDMSTASYIKERQKSFEIVRAMCVSLGIILCIICWVPNLFTIGGFERIGAALMFLIVGIGVFLIVYSNNISSSYNTLLKLNDIVNVKSGNKGNLEKPVKYVNKTAEFICETYWPVVVCLYLIISFLTFKWNLTWIIWPIAGVAHRAVVINCTVEDE